MSGLVSNQVKSWKPPIKQNNVKSRYLNYYISDNKISILNKQINFQEIEYWLMVLSQWIPQQLRFVKKINERKSFQCKRYFSLVIETNRNRVTRGCDVPEHILRPSYAVDKKCNGFLSSLFNVARKQPHGLVKETATVDKIRRACRIGRKVLNHMKLAVKVGVTTDDLDYVAHHLICKENAYPSPLKYQSFPKSICTSVNNVVVHGIPDSRPLECGDLVNVDISVFIDGVHGDLSEMFLLGEVDESGKRLVDVTKRCLDKAISICMPGQQLNTIGKTISHIAHAHGYSVCPHFVGHGIGEEFHEIPQILHHDNSFPGNMVPGMVFTIEPVICEGVPNISYWNDGWTAVTKDKQRAAQFEHTIHITDGGVEILTLDDKDDEFLQPNDLSMEYVSNLLNSKNSHWSRK